jgi:hypothetical protein
VFCSFCGSNLNQKSKCESCGQASAQIQVERNQENLLFAQQRLEKEAWPSYGWMVGFFLMIASVVVFGSGFAWEGWAPRFLFDWTGFFSIWIFVLGAGYAIGWVIDDSKLRNVEPGDSFRLTSWRFILASVSGAALLYLTTAVDSDFFFS